MSIGSFGGIAFRVSEKTLLTFSNYQRSAKARWNQHDVIGHKPRKEFVGADIERITFTVLLKASLGVNPESVISKWRMMRDKGTVSRLIVGNKPITQNYFLIDDLTESEMVVDNKGKFWEMNVSLSLEEYVQQKQPEKPKKKNPATTPGAKTKQNPEGTMTITVKSVHIRSGPGTKYKVLGYAMKGKKLTIYKKVNGWYSLGNGRYISANPAYSTFKAEPKKKGSGRVGNLRSAAVNKN